MKGRSTTVIAVRVPDSLAIRLKDLAGKEGLTVSEWCKAALARAAGMVLAK
jgi:predicted DNA-binding protein